MAELASLSHSSVRQVDGLTVALPQDSAEEQLMIGERLSLPHLDTDVACQRLVACRAAIETVYVERFRLERFRIAFSLSASLCVDAHAALPTPRWSARQAGKRSSK